MCILVGSRSRLKLFLAGLFAVGALAGAGTATAATGSVVYTYDALGRVISANYDTGVLIIYSYDAAGNRTQQVINVNTKPLCLGSSAHSNPTTWGAGLWSTYSTGC